MSSLTQSDILHVGKLANLTFKKSELKTFKDQLSHVLNYFEELKKVNTDNVEPTSQTTGLENVSRSDEIDNVSVLSNEEATSGTEKIHNGAFVVPQVLDKEQ